MSYKHSDETKAKMSATHKARVRKPCSEETKAKIRASLQGRSRPEETRAKMSATRKGMKHSDETLAKLTKHGHTAGGQTPTYNSWDSMRQRCNNPKMTQYARYGGRGISVCPAWSDFATFLADMGERPEGTSLDRIDNDGNYEPSNCRWATPIQQANNKSPKRKLNG